MIEISRLGYVGVRSPEYARWADIGSRVFAMNEGPAGSDGAVRLKFDDADYRLSIHPGDRDELAYIGWEVRDGAAFRDAVEHLDACGIEHVVDAPIDSGDRGVSRRVTFHDPFGIQNEIFVAQRSSYGSYAPPRRTAGFQGTGLGHVVLVVPDGEVAERFYSRALGLRLTSMSLLPGTVGVMRCLRCNPRHHSLAVIERPGQLGLEHIMIESQSFDDVAVAYEAIGGEQSTELSATLGKHIGDDMTSFYWRTPSGFDLEYGVGELVMTDEEQWHPPLTDVPSGAQTELWGHQRRHLGPQASVHPYADGSVRAPSDSHLAQSQQVFSGTTSTDAVARGGNFASSTTDLIEEAMTTRSNQ